MRIHWGRPISSWIIFGILSLVLGCITIYPPDTNPQSSFEMQSVSSDVEESPLNDSLPYYQYKKVEDSLKAVKLNTDYFSSSSGGSEVFFSYLGIATYGTNGNKNHFLVIRGYKLDDFTSIENKKTGSVLTYPVWNNVGKDFRKGHLEKKVIPVKYQGGNKAFEGTVYLPLKEGVGNLLKVLFWILAIMGGCVAFYVILYVPLRLLYQLTKGKAFTEENIGNLYLTGWGLVGLSLLASLVPIIAHLITQSQIPSEIHFSYYATLLKPWKILVSGLGILLLAKAFLQGFNLKEEQALTI